MGPGIHTDKVPVFTLCMYYCSAGSRVEQVFLMVVRQDGIGKAGARIGPLEIPGLGAGVGGQDSRRG